MLVIVVRRIAGELGVNFLKRIRWEFSLSVCLVVFVFAYGLRAILSRGTPPPATAHIVALQPNIPQQEKFDRAIEDEVFARLERLTRAADALRPDLILWPEAATPRGIFADELNWEFIQRITNAASCPLLVGTVEDYIEGEHPGAYNSAILLTRGQSPEKLPTYRKTHLVPFGEYLPLRPLLGWIAGGLVPSDISPGKGFAVLDTPVGKIAPLICFEDTLGDLTRSFVAGDAQLLINLTNDGWFLRTAGAEQHLANAIFRAVENRRPLLRCTNTGITCLIDTHGFVDRGRLRAFEQGLSNHSVHLEKNPPLTFYTRHGDWIAWLSALLAIGCVVKARIMRKAAA
jgi:apolipoprotein N-acyltransferase